jgi:hypothetical protein
VKEDPESKVKELLVEPIEVLACVMECAIRFMITQRGYSFTQWNAYQHEHNLPSNQRFADDLNEDIPSMTSQLAAWKETRMKELGITEDAKNMFDTDRMLLIELPELKRPLVPNVIDHMILRRSETVCTKAKAEDPFKGLHDWQDVRNIFTLSKADGTPYAYLTKFHQVMQTYYLFPKTLPMDCWVDLTRLGIVYFAVNEFGSPLDGILPSVPPSTIDLTLKMKCIG